MFKKLLSAMLVTSIGFLSASAMAGNEYGVIAEIRYNTPTDAAGASIVVVLEEDQGGFHLNSEIESCFADGVQNWYVNLDSHPLVTERLVERLEQAERERTVVRLFGEDGLCDSGEPQYNDKIMEAYFYK